MPQPRPSPRLLLAAAVAAAAVPASAQVVGDAEVISLLMTDYGLAVEPGTHPDGTPELASRIDGTRFRVLFYGCDPGPCETIQFTTGFDLARPISAARLNDWNRDRRFGKAFVDDEGDPFVEMDVNLYGDGVGRRNFEDTLDLWRQVLSDFRDFIGW